MKIELIDSCRPDFKPNRASYVTIEIKPENHTERALMHAIEAGTRTVHVGRDGLIINVKLRRLKAER